MQWRTGRPPSHLQHRRLTAGPAPGAKKFSRVSCFGITTAWSFVFLYPQYATSGAPSRKATHSSVGVTVPGFGFSVFVIAHVIA